VAGCYEHWGEISGSGATELVFQMCSILRHAFVRVKKRSSDKSI
jgi:hypothetical protein